MLFPLLIFEATNYTLILIYLSKNKVYFSLKIYYTVRFTASKFHINSNLLIYFGAPKIAATTILFSTNCVHPVY